MKTKNEKISIIKKLIPDENLRHIIFNYEDDDFSFLSDDKNCLLYFSNIMTFSVVMIWNVFLHWKKENNNSEKIDGSNSFWRIYNMLDKTCDPTKINGEFVDDLLANLEIDCLLDINDSSSFVETLGINGFFNFKQRNSKLSKYIYMVKQRRLTSRYLKNVFDFDSLCECINIFSYLRDVKIHLNQMDILYNDEKMTNMHGITLDFSDIYGCAIKIVDCHQSFIVINNMATYYMEEFIVDDARRFDENGLKYQTIKINYAQLGDTDQFSVLLLDNNSIDNRDKYLIVKPSIIENFFLNYDIINIYSNKKDGKFFRDYILLNNKYLKEFSYIISDTLSVNLKNHIIDYFSPKYKEIFDRMYVTSLYNDKDIVGYRWDEIILFLLLEEGVYEFLRFILNYQNYDDFKESFKRRYGKNSIDLICQSDDFILNPGAILPYGSSQSAKNDCYARALITLATKLFTQNNWLLEKSIYPTTIDDIIVEFDRVYGLSKYTEKDKLVYFSNTLLHVIRFITKFYNGVFQYARSKKQSILDLEMNDEYYLGYKKYNEAKEEWINEMRKVISTRKNKNNKNQFFVYASMSKDEIAKNIEKNFNYLISFNDECSTYHDEQNEILFDVLGRRSLFDSNKMKDYKNEIVNLISNNCSLDRLYFYIKNYLLYLKTGLDEKERNEASKNLIEYAIYPIVGKYYNGVTSVDGYRYSLFKVNSKDEELSHINIKMITEDEFDFGLSYYCIPNINRIANVKHERQYSKIWVSPIIIPCSVYLPQSFSKLEQLDDENDFEQAIELIYNSDPTVYGFLFGNIENARRIFPYLLNDATSKFYKNHYRILRKDNEIVAIASLYNYSNISWGTDGLLKAFGEERIEIPETFECGLKILKSQFNDYFGKMYYQIDDVCVKEKYRNQGIAQAMLMYLIKITENMNMSVRLSVYSDNKVAYNLYSSLGFVPIDVQQLNDNDIKYIQMVKI